MMIKTITDLDLHNKRVLVRVDFNVPLDDNRTITDDTRIVESLPTIKKIIADGGIPILMSHLGRPKGERKEKYSLAPVAAHLQTLLGITVHFATDCIGEPATTTVAAAKPGEVVLLENLRFYAEEEKNDAGFAEQLSHLGDVYINDAFGTAHRAHASTEGVAKFFVGNRASGYLIAKELEYIGGALQNPQRPFTAILGGSKVSDKIEVISNLLSIADAILIGGGMANTFAKAMGYEMGDSLVETDKVDLAKELITKSENKLIFPVDAVIADAFDANANTQIVDMNKVPTGWRVLDIGPKSVALFAQQIANSKTVVWNGPMGVFEMDAFNKGTFAVAQALANATTTGTITIIGGGDSAAAIAQAGLKDQVSHVSTGGGASLEYLEGKQLPGIVVLDEQ
ncbi:MAG: phosphoglycerate kinase [Bacteriodetes bacterium]|nr:phosphoglycerate kinase [Bacteroidota bacterium]